MISMKPVDFLKLAGATDLLKKLDEKEGGFSYLRQFFSSPSTLTLRIREAEVLSLIEAYTYSNPGHRRYVYFRLTDIGKKILEIYKQMENI